MSQIIKFGANRVWRTYQGGKQLDIIEGKGEPQDSSFPEDWIGLYKKFSWKNPIS